MRSTVKIAPAATVDDYIKRAPAEWRPRLQKMRQTIRKAAPEADEVISYAIPGYKYQGMLVFFAVWKDHISFYPAPWGAEPLQEEMSAYEGSKGTIKFPHNKPLPLSLITKMVRYRVKENLERAGAKKNTAEKTATKAVKATAATKKKTKPANDELVTAYMKNLKSPLKAETEALRSIIKSADKGLSERIKWNAPSYYYKTADEKEHDIVTFGPYKNGKILLVFHHTAIEKIKSPLLEGNCKERRLMYLENMAAVKKNKKEIERIVKENVKMIKK